MPTYHTRDYTEQTFVVEDEILRFENGFLKTDKAELVAMIPPHHPIYDESGEQVNVKVRIKRGKRCR